MVPGQRLDRLCAKIKFLKIIVLLHYAIKTVNWPVRWVENRIPKNSASIANRVFKKLRVKTRDNYVITPSEVVCSAGFICQVWKSHSLINKKKIPIKYGMLHLKTVSLLMNMISCYSWLKQACSHWKSRTAATTDESKNVVEKSCL